MGRDYTIFALTPGYVHFTKDPIKNRNYINVVEFNPNEKPASNIHDLEFKTKLADGWRNDSIYSRDKNGHRRFDLVNLTQLPPVEKSDLAAVEFDAMTAHLKALNLDTKLSGDKFQFPERFHEAVKEARALNENKLKIVNLPTSEDVQ
jgi:hypothetical protein